MANLVVTRTGNVITVVFNDYHTNGFIDLKQSSYNATSYISKVHEMDDHVLVWGSDQKLWKVIPQGGDITKGLIVDSIDEVTPTSIDHLFTLINSLFQ